MQVEYTFLERIKRQFNITSRKLTVHKFWGFLHFVICFRLYFKMLGRNLGK